MEVGVAVPILFVLGAVVLLFLLALIQLIMV